MNDIWKYFQPSLRSSKHPSGRHNKVLTQLQQGHLLLNNRKRIASREYREGFTNANTTNVENTLTHIQGLHDEFMGMISELSSLEAEYLEGLQDFSNRMNSGIAGKNIKYGPPIYYVTKYGYYRHYPTWTIWSTRVSHCGGEGEGEYEELENPVTELNLLRGPDMKEGSICGYEGINVQYNGKYAYVKMNGEVLEYTDNLTPQDVESCSSDIVNVNEATWNGLMKDKIGNMDTNTKCLLDSDDIRTTIGVPIVEIKKEITALVPRIQEMAQTIQGELANIELLMSDMNNVDAEQKAKFSKYSQELNQITDTYQNDYTLDALHETMFITERQQYYQYIVYFVLLILCFGVLYYLAKSIGGVAKQITESVQFVGDNVGRFGRGAPRQSVLRREAKDASAFGGVGFTMNSLNPFSSASSTSPMKTPKMSTPNAKPNASPAPKRTSPIQRIPSLF